MFGNAIQLDFGFFARLFPRAEIERRLAYLQQRQAQYDNHNSRERALPSKQFDEGQFARQLDAVMYGNELTQRANHKVAMHEAMLKQKAQTRHFDWTKRVYEPIQTVGVGVGGPGHRAALEKNVPIVSRGHRHLLDQSTIITIYVRATSAYPLMSFGCFTKYYIRRLSPPPWTPTSPPCTLSDSGRKRSIWT